MSIGAPPVAPVLVPAPIVLMTPELPVITKEDPVPVLIIPLFQVKPLRVMVAFVPVVRVPPDSCGLIKVDTALFAVVIVVLPSIFRPTVPGP